MFRIAGRNHEGNVDQEAILALPLRVQLFDGVTWPCALSK
jgi:hypothetical protein